MEAGLHSLVFNAGELNTGIYFNKLITDNLVITNKMILMK